MSDALPDTPSTLAVEDRDEVAVVLIDRPAKRNALNDVTVLGLESFFLQLPARVRAVVIGSTSDHLSAGLDLSELLERDTLASVQHSRMWHRAFAAIESGRVPVISSLTGAVIGGGLELAAATHLRVADSTAFYALPEGQRGIFVGGGASVRLPRLIGLSRVTDLMLTGRVYDAEEGHRAGISHYLVEPGEALPRAIALADKVATVAPGTVYGVLHALPRIAAAAPDQGFFMESLMAAVASTSDDAKARLNAFLDGTAAKVRAPKENESSD